VIAPIAPRKTTANAIPETYERCANTLSSISDGAPARAAQLMDGEDDEHRDRGGHHRLDRRRPAQVAPLDERVDEQERAGRGEGDAVRSRRRERETSARY